jgi:hypothetical protein
MVILLAFLSLVRCISLAMLEEEARKLAFPRDFGLRQIRLRM